jgi:drug/metabolite transporter (DMT)-like permease
MPDIAKPVLRASVAGALWMLGSVVSLSAMAVAGRGLLDSMHALEIVFWRAAIGLLILVVVIAARGGIRLRAQRLDLHLYRNLSHIVAQFLWFLSLGLMPLANVFALEYTTPMWAALLATVFMGERFSRGKWVALACGVTGILVILRPGIGDFDASAFIMLGAAIGFATSIIFTKSLARRDSVMVVLVYMNVIQLPVSLVPSLFVWVAPTLADVPWLLLLGLSSLGAHLCLTRALAVADATVVMPVDFLRLPLIALVGFFFYQEIFDIAIILGAAIIFLGNLYNVRRESGAP